MPLLKLISRFNWLDYIIYITKPSIESVESVESGTSTCMALEAKPIKLFAKVCTQSLIVLYNNYCVHYGL